MFVIYCNGARLHDENKGAGVVLSFTTSQAATAAADALFARDSANRRNRRGGSRLLRSAYVVREEP